MEILCQEILGKEFVNSSMRYLSIQRSKLCPGFENSLIKYLKKNENLRTFSFVLNNECKQVASDEFSNIGKTRASIYAQSPLEEELSGLGFKTDIAILTILDTATLNKSLEVVQIVQCLQDYH